MNVFDAHTHFFGREFYEHQAAQAPDESPESALERIRAGGLHVPGPDAAAHAARWNAELDRHGVARVVLFASAPAEMAAVGGVAAESNGRFVPFCVVNPMAPATIEALDAMQSRFQFRGLILFPAMHDYSIQAPEVTAALEVAKAHDMVVFVHCGKLRVGVRRFLGLNPDFPSDRSRPRDLAMVARAQRDVAFIIPHFGSGYFDEALDLAAACHNVYLDTAGSNSWAAEHSPPLSLTEVFQHTRDAIGTDRILFGSDSGVFPRGYRTDIRDAQTAAMREAGYDDDDQAAVLGGNLARLLGD
ncbi:MAG TPA: amidohydrolase family protein [Candidatus Krumholzibacteria bacterium]|nr:amidohydrolase family protein [Candidatus Krumholzibacteria bacterium]